MPAMCNARRKRWREYRQMESEIGDIRFVVDNALNLETPAFAKRGL